jgi:hypothetical protein
MQKYVYILKQHSVGAYRLVAPCWITPFIGLHLVVIPSGIHHFSSVMHITTVPYPGDQPVTPTGMLICLIVANILQKNY